MKQELEIAITHFNSWLDSIKRYADCLHDEDTVKYGNILVNLAKTFLSVSEEMESLKDNNPHTIQYFIDSAFARNTAIDQCTLVATRLVAERDKKLKWCEDIINDDNNKINSLICDNLKKDAEIEALKKELDEANKCCIRLAEFIEKNNELWNDFISEKFFLRGGN